MLNHIVLMGRLTRDPEQRRTSNGTAVTSFSIAVERDGKGQNGQKETDFIDIVTWQNTAEYVSKYFSKGRMAVVSGRLQMRQWTDKNGNKRIAAEVVADSVYFGDSRPQQETPATQSPGYYPPGNFQPPAQPPIQFPESPAPNFSTIPDTPPEFSQMDLNDDQLPF